MIYIACGKSIKRQVVLLVGYLFFIDLLYMGSLNYFNHIAVAKEISGNFKEEILADYITKLTADINRNNNISLACKAINGIVVYPNKIFSFNQTVGPRTKEKGYKVATIFVNGRKKKGTGGGVCQVSSTLYNAVLNAKLTVVERHPHSLPVAYVPKGKDATVSYDTKDFKFKNNKLFPIKIYAEVYKNELRITIVKLIEK